MADRRHASTGMFVALHTEGRLPQATGSHRLLPVSSWDQGHPIHPPQRAPRPASNRSRALRRANAAKRQRLSSLRHQGAKARVRATPAMQVNDGTMEPEALPRLETDPPPPARGAAGREALARKKARRGQVSATNAANGALGAAALGKRLEERREVLSKLDNTATPLPAPLSTRTTHPWASHLANASKTASAVQSPTAPVSQLESVKFPTTPAQLHEAYQSSPSSCSLPVHRKVPLRARPPTTEREKVLDDLDPVLECCNCNLVYEEGKHVFEGARWLSQANSAQQCRDSAVHQHLLDVYARAMEAAERGDLDRDAAGAPPRIQLEMCWWCFFGKRALEREEWLHTHVSSIIRKRELPKQFLNALMKDGYIELGAVFETGPLSMRIDRRVVRDANFRAEKINGMPSFETDGRLELLRPNRPTVCAAIVVLAAPLFELFSGVAELEKQLRGMSIGPEEIDENALQFFEFSRATVTKGVSGDPRVELAYLVAANGEGAAVARGWRDAFRAAHPERNQQTAEALTPGGQLPATIAPPRQLFRSMQSKLLIVEHFDGAKVSAPQEMGKGGMAGSLHLAAVERRASEACARARAAHIT